MTINSKISEFTEFLDIGVKLTAVLNLDNEINNKNCYVFNNTVFLLQIPNNLFFYFNFFVS